MSDPTDPGYPTLEWTGPIPKPGELYRVTEVALNADMEHLTAVFQLSETCDGASPDQAVELWLNWPRGWEGE